MFLSKIIVVYCCKIRITGLFLINSVGDHNRDKKENRLVVFPQLLAA